MKSFLAIAIVTLLGGCGLPTDRPVQSATTNSVPTKAASDAFLVVDLPQHERILSLPKNEAEFLRQVLAKTSRVENPSVPLVPTMAVSVDGTRYYLDDDQLISFAAPGSRHWSSPGITRRLLDAANKNGANKAPEDTARKLADPQR
jgi:hypothetical protein